MVYLCNHKSVLFDKEEAKTIFEENQKYLNCPYSFDEMMKSRWFFTVMNKKGETVGITYVLCENIGGEEKPFYSGASKRKSHKDMLEAHKILLELLFKFYDEVYTWTPHLHAHIFNKKAGMEYIGDNIFRINKIKFLGE